MSALEEIKEKIDLKIDEDQLTATLFLVNEEQAENISIEEINLLIEEYNLLYGIIDMHSSGWQQKLIDNYQFVIAQGKKPENGKHGSLIVKQSTENELSEEEKTNFRDVTKIPMVEANDLLAQLIPPTDGEPGIDIFNQPIKQKKGKPFKCRAGKNVTFNEKDQTYIASTNGQLSIGDHILNVFPLYEIPGDLSLKTGNIDFNGSVTIRGNIPTGFKVIAKGDVIVYGIVEASYIDAGGNIFISEGVAGMDKAIIKAGQNIESYYINQAQLSAGNDIKVKKSIMHSTCVAQGDIRCNNGNIIGGSSSAGRVIEVKELGNKANSKTELAFGVSKKVVDRVSALKKKQKEVKESRQKLRILGDQLQQKKDAVGVLMATERIMLLKQRNMFEKMSQQLSLINEELSELQFEIGNMQEMKLIVKGKAHENVVLIFGKYKRILQQEHKYFQAYLEDKEVTIQSL